MPTFAKTLLATVAALALLALAGPPANAQQHEAAAQQGPLAENCWGSKLETRILRDHVTNRRVGRTELWYSPADRGTNCVITYNEVPGKAITYAYLIVDDNRNRDNTGRTEKGDRVAFDQDNYEYYAGASFLRNTNGKCVRFGGSVISRQGHGAFGSGWTHCS
jgi:hypothetical protein